MSPEAPVISVSDLFFHGTSLKDAFAKGILVYDRRCEYDQSHLMRSWRRLKSRWWCCDSAFGWTCRDVGTEDVDMKSAQHTDNRESTVEEKRKICTYHHERCLLNFIFFLISPQLVFLIMKINLVNGLEDHVRWIRKPVAIDKTKRHVRFLRKNGFFKRQIAVDRMKSGIESDLVSMVKHKCTH